MKITAHIALVALVGSVVATFGGAPAGATYPGSDGLVVFVTARSGFAQIWTVDPTNGVEHDLSDGSTAEGAPAWNPFGAKIAFSRAADVWVMKANGTGRADLTASDPHDDDQPTWSPNGKKIAFVSDRETNGRTQIFVMNANGSHVVRLTNDAGADSDPQWSPDGTHIAFVSNVSGNFDVWSMGANGASPTDLTNNTAADAAPAWSPDGDHIVFTSGRSHPGSVGADLFVMDADGGNVVPLNHESNGYSDGDAGAFSPDGLQLVFSANNGGGSQQLWLDESGGGENVRLTNDPGNPHNVAADWQPVVPAPTLKLRPLSGMAGTTVHATGTGFAPGEKVKLTFTDAAHTKTVGPVAIADSSGAIATAVTAPVTAATGKATILAVGITSGLSARKPFTVTAPS